MSRSFVSGSFSLQAFTSINLGQAIAIDTFSTLHVSHDTTNTLAESPHPPEMGLFVESQLPLNPRNPRNRSDTVRSKKPCCIDKVTSGPHWCCHPARWSPHHPYWQTSEVMQKLIELSKIQKIAPRCGPFAAAELCFYSGHRRGVRHVAAAVAVAGADRRRRSSRAGPCWASGWLWVCWWPTWLAVGGSGANPRIPGSRGGTNDTAANAFGEGAFAIGVGAHSGDTTSTSTALQSAPTRMPQAIVPLQSARCQCDWQRWRSFRARFPISRAWC